MRFEATQGLDALKENKLINVRDAYNLVYQGIDPETRLPIYVDCTVGGTTYRMNAGAKAAGTFDQGLRLAERNGETSTFIVDFYDNNHIGIPLADAIEVNRTQSNDARVHYQEKQTLKAQIAAATTVAEVRAIDVAFSVSVLPL